VAVIIGSFPFPGTREWLTGKAAGEQIDCSNVGLNPWLEYPPILFALGVGSNPSDIPINRRPFPMFPQNRLTERVNLAENMFCARPYGVNRECESSNA
jgi:hypothetical protein